MEFIKPSPNMEKPFITMAMDYKRANEHRYQLAFDEGFDFGQYIENLENKQKQECLQPGHVPSTTFWLMDDAQKICGVSRLRHYLTPDLEMEGGHIGYDVPPSERMKGHGTVLLAETLKEARNLDIFNVLVTCDSDNIGSAKIIRANGGVFEGEGVSEESGKLVSRYWIRQE